MNEDEKTNEVKVRVETLTKTYEGEIEKRMYIDVYTWFCIYAEESKWLYITPKEGHDILVSISKIVSIQEIE